MKVNPFEYRSPDEEQIRKIRRVRETLASAYVILMVDVPAGAERTLAIRKLEECSMWANKAIVFPEGYEK